MFSHSIILGTTFTAISTNFFCINVDGNWPARCLQNSENSEANCQKYCTELDNCIAYGAGQGYCVIIPATGSCPTGWTFGSGTRTSQSSDLKQSSLSGYNCMAKGKKDDKLILYFTIHVSSPL